MTNLTLKFSFSMNKFVCIQVGSRYKLFTTNITREGFLHRVYLTVGLNKNRSLLVTSAAIYKYFLGYVYLSILFTSFFTFSSNTSDFYYI